MRISPQLGAGLIIFACALFAYVIINLIVIRFPVRRVSRFITIALPLLIGVLIYVFLWNNILGLATPPIRELPNAYIHQTVNSDGTLLEFGARRYDTDLDVTIVTDGYTNVEDWWDSPGLTDRSSNAQGATSAFIEKIKPSYITIEKPDIVDRNTSSPIFAFKLNSPQIIPGRSYYVRFNSTEPVIIQSVIFGSVTVIGE